MALPILDTQPMRPSFARGPRSLQAVRLLRLSVTDRCNLRCGYCMPQGAITYFAREEVLQAADIIAVARAAARIGVDHFKLTGGEPTVRADIVEIVRGIRALGPADLSMTTNGLRLEELSRPLKAAGLDRLTISLDSLRPARFDRITGYRGHGERGGLETVLRGLAAAQRIGFTRLKLNVVVIGGVNDDEVADFARLTLDQPWTVRFIEYMPLGDAPMVDDAEDAIVDNALIRRRIERELGSLRPVDRQSESGVGPASVYSLEGAAGRVGFISAMSQPFCETCNRLRLTARGELRSCLFDGGEVNVLDALRPVPNHDQLIEMMRACVALKPELHAGRGNRAMNQIGG